MCDGGPENGTRRVSQGDYGKIISVTRGTDPAFRLLWSRRTTTNGPFSGGQESQGRVECGTEIRESFRLRLLNCFTGVTCLGKWTVEVANL